MADPVSITPSPSGGGAKDNTTVSLSRASTDATTAVVTATTTAVPASGGPPSEAPPPPSSPARCISTTAFCFMAVGSSIGAGLLVASGTSLQKGGPAAVLIAFALLGLAVWLTMCALGELAAAVPARGSFYGYSLKFVSGSWGFAMGWNYMLNFILIVAFELTVIVMLAQYWTPGSSIVGSGLYLLVLGAVPLLLLHLLLGGKGYSEAEAGFAMLKVWVLVTFMITAIVIAAGGTPEGESRGFENYQNGQAFRHGFSGFVNVFVAAGMAYGGTEMLGLSAAECRDPVRVMPIGSYIVAGRIAFCYVLPLFFVGLVVKPSDFGLAPFAGLHVVSPFVVGTRIAGLPGLACVINLALVISVFSMANAAVFASSRALAALCREGMGPRLLGRTSRVRWWKVEVEIPRNALLVVGAVANLAWVVVYSRGAWIFEWLLSLASVSNYFTWLSICVCHVRFRKVMATTGHGLDELRWKAPFGVYGSYLAIAVISLSMLAQIVAAALPPVLEGDVTTVEHLFMGILGFLFVSLLFLGHLAWVSYRGGKTWRQRLLIPLDNIAVPELNNLASTKSTMEKRGGIFAP